MGFKFRDEPAQKFMYVVKRGTGGRFAPLGLNLESSITQDATPASLAFNDTVARRPCRGRIDSEYAQASRTVARLTILAHAC